MDFYYYDRKRCADCDKEIEEGELFYGENIIQEDALTDVICFECWENRGKPQMEYDIQEEGKASEEDDALAEELLHSNDVMGVKDPGEWHSPDVWKEYS